MSHVISSKVVTRSSEVLYCRSNFNTYEDCVLSKAFSQQVKLLRTT